MNDDEKYMWSTAFHEAGHAVAAYVLEVPFESISITPTSTSSGRLVIEISKVLPEQRAIICYAGGDAGMRVAGQFGDAGGQDADLNIAWDASQHVPDGGQSAENFRFNCMVKSQTIVKDWWPAITALANELVGSPTLAQAEAIHVIETAMKNGDEIRT